MMQSLTSSDTLDQPPTSMTLSREISTRLDRLRRLMDRQRERSDQNGVLPPGWSPSEQEYNNITPQLQPDASIVGNELRHWSRTDRPPCRRSSDELDDDKGRQAKRQRVAGESPFRYGYHGQADLARLRLELSNVIGGTFNSRGPIDYGPENILSNDRSVYCSRSKECCLVLQHHAGLEFCLESLCIVAPDRGFSAP